MGFSQYWYTPKELDKTKFLEFAKDVKKIIKYSNDDLGIKIANGLGEPNTEPIFEDDLIALNGSDAQPVGMWTTTEDVHLAWPSPNASITEPIENPFIKKTDGVWFAGDLVSQRVAPIDNLTGLGSGSYETFAIRRVVDEKQEPSEKYKNLYLDCCKTSYRPYDLTVTAILIALKHFFPECKIESDGEEKDWLDGKFLCNNLLGYGIDFELDN